MAKVEALRGAVAAEARIAVEAARAVNRRGGALDEGRMAELVADVWGRTTRLLGAAVPGSKVDLDYDVRIGDWAATIGFDGESRRVRVPIGRYLLRDGDGWRLADLDVEGRDVVVERVPDRAASIALAADLAGIALGGTRIGHVPGRPDALEGRAALAVIREAAMTGKVSARRLAREAGMDVGELDEAMREAGVGGLWDLGAGTSGEGSTPTDGAGGA